MEDAGLLIYLNFSLKEYFSDFNSEGDLSSTHIQLFIFGFLFFILDSLHNC